ncbi:type II secretion system protein [bacterium]|nr:type II secretion system protein [bacterium]
MKNKKSAFTLAEVLLVLAIIGVIAAVTIPAVMQQSSEKKFATLAKKSASTLQNAIDQKIASVPVGPGDLNVGFLHWIIDGEEDGTNTLKVIKRNNLNNTTIAQTPDGMVYYIYNSDRCTTPSTRANPLGCASWVFVDLDGADGPTKTTVENAVTRYSQSFQNAKAYDTIGLRVEADGKVRARGHGNIIGTRSMKYLGTELSGL